MGRGHDHERTPLKNSYSERSASSRSRIPLTDSAQSAQRKLKLACICSLVFMLAEVVGGFIAGSLAIMTDAAHLLSDVAGFCISLFAIWMSTMPASSRLTFGFHRAEVIGAVISVLFIWVLTGVLVYAAIDRFILCLQPDTEELVDGKLMFIVAVIGLCVNLALMKILGEHGHSHGIGHSHDHSHSHGHSHSHDHANDEENGYGSVKTQAKQSLENLNIQAAYIHALGDFIQSIGVCIAGALIWYNPSWQIADPIATFLFSILVLATTIGIVKDSLHVLMEGTPEGFEPNEIEDGLRDCTSVVAVHDLHIWSMNMGNPSLSVHLVSVDPDASLHAAQDYLMSKGITHTTIQVEKPTTTYPRDCNSNLSCGQDSPQNSA